ncbi:MAG: trypsin-like serine protease [Myxococcota bacterium]
MVTLLSLAFAAPPDVLTVETEEGELLDVRLPPPDLMPYVVGGEPAQQGEWDDAVGVVFDSSYVGCTGTLIAPDVVLTAGHCAGGISHVVIGTKNWLSNAGEWIAVEYTSVHPSYNSAGAGYDIAVLKLRQESSYPPRVIANDCVIDEDLYNGASVTIVGFGNTNQDGSGSTTRLNVADSIVRDADCLENRLDGIVTGCQPALRPGGEIGAGGRVDVDGDGSVDQADACFGDSGGPLYLNTERGSFLVGVTSRGFLGVNPNFACRDGGIWTRPDAVISFIENQGGITIARPACGDIPTVDIGELHARPGGSDRTDIVVTDPDGASFSAEIVDQPALGVASIDGGRIVFQAYKGVEGTETITVRITDDGSALYPLSPVNVVEVPVQITVGGGCGCASSSLPGSFGMLVGLLGFLVRRR